MMTLKEVAQEFKVSRRTVYRWIKAGKLKAFMLGDQIYRVDEADFEDFKNKKETK